MIAVWAASAIFSRHTHAHTHTHLDIVNYTDMMKCLFSSLPSALLLAAYRGRAEVEQMLFKYGSTLDEVENVCASFNIPLMSAFTSL